MKFEAQNLKCGNNSKRESRNGALDWWRICIHVFGGLRVAGCGLLAAGNCWFAGSAKAAATTNPPPVVIERAPETSREFFNAGTRMLRAGKLREAEAYLQTALTRQDESLQTAALYNLGHARFAQGVAELKQASDSKQTTGRARTAAWQGEAAVRAADQALASKDVGRMLDAYMQGHGARRELNSALKAVREALKIYAGVLLKWQRASGDFKSAAELNPADTNAQHNAGIVDRHIARLIDQIRQMQQAAAAAAQMREQLGEKLKQLRGQIPDDMMPPGAPGPGDEDEDMPEGPLPGMMEGASKPGDELKMSPEDAARMLDGYRLDGERRLPMSEGQDGGKPRDPNRPTW
jgi:hypothetical protein